MYIYHNCHLTCTCTLFLQDNTAKGKTVTSSSTKQQSASPEDEITDGLEASKEGQESEDYDASAVRDIGTTASDEGGEEKDDIKESEVG